MSNQRTAPIPIDLARSQLLASIDAIAATEIVSLDESCGRIAAEAITSLLDLPRTHNAAVDGYGVDSTALAAAPDKPFKIIGVARAGHPFDGVIGVREAIEIYTGAVMPSGVDCVAMHEVRGSSTKAPVSSRESKPNAIPAAPAGKSNRFELLMLAEIDFCV